ncbi:porin family protein [Novosphingobium sp. SG707]|uniref:porin family protein n=1 Tax=Novosphingobium sp. SG707 TaxID=2586996 RepID=UPI0032BFCDB5
MASYWKIATGLTAAVGTYGAVIAQTPSHFTASQLFAMAERALAARDADTASTIYAALEHDPNPSLRNEASFRHANLLKKQGRLTEAALLLRTILDSEPNAQPARLELADVLAQMGDLTAARRELRQAQAGGLPPQVAQVVKQYAAALRSRKPWGGSFELALAPDSNINRATSATTLDTVIAPLNLSQDARQQSGLGVKESSQIYGRLDLGKSFTLVPRVSSQATLYQSSQFNDISASAQLGLEYRHRADRITPSAGYTWRWYGGNIYARTQSLSLDWLHPAGKRAQIDTTISLNRVRYATNSLQDGMIYTAAVSYERALSARSGASVTLSANRQTARDPGYATASGAVGGVYWHDFGKTTLFATASGSRLGADARLFLFPERRTDWYLRGGIGAVWRKVEVAGFSPVVRVAYERNWSTVGIYDFRRVTTDVGITRSF